MAFNGSGTFAIINTFVPGTVILSSLVNQNLTDIATGLTTCVLKNGTQTITANIPMAGFKLTGLGAGTAAGDSVRYEQVFGSAANSMGVLLTSGTWSAVATGPILLPYTGYRAFTLILTRVIPATDDVELRMRVSTDGGSTYDSGASNYGMTLYAQDDANNAALASGSRLDHIAVSSSNTGDLIGNGAAEGTDLSITIFDPTNTARWTQIHGNATSINANATPGLSSWRFDAARRAAQNTDAVQFYFNSGNIASGAYAVFGIT